MNNEFESEETHLGEVSAASLDAANAFVAAQGAEKAVNAIQTLFPVEYPAAVSFLREFAALLYSCSARAAQDEGIEPKPLREQLKKYEAAKKKLLN